MKRTGDTQVAHVEEMPKVMTLLQGMMVCSECGCPFCIGSFYRNIGKKENLLLPLFYRMHTLEGVRKCNCKTYKTRLSG